MCGRYTLERINELEGRYDAYSAVNQPFSASYNIAPGTMNPVIARKSPNSIRLMKWGLVPFWAKDPKIGYRMINARSEGIENKPAFRKPIRERRCLIPTTGFYEWKKLNLEGKEEKHPYFFKVKGDEVFSFAGLYDVWHDAEGKEFLSYSIITTKANSGVAEVHDRMPVILNKIDENTFLDPKTNLDTVLHLLKPYPAGNMDFWPVSNKVNNPANDNSKLTSRVQESLPHQH
jgi:putative SOS response-associated peptidase YedK